MTAAKTRLQETTGLPEHIIEELNLAFIVDTLRKTLQTTGNSVYVSTYPETTIEDFFRRISAVAFPLSDEERGMLEVFPQRGESFAERIENCFSYVHQQTGGAVIMLGSDAPHFPTSDIERACSEAQSGFYSIGLTYGGGLWFIALPKSYFSEANIFGNIFSSNADTEVSAFANEIKKFGTTAKIGSLCFDIDLKDDLVTLIALASVHTDSLQLAGSGVIEADCTKSVIDRFSLRAERSADNSREMTISYNN